MPYDITVYKGSASGEIVETITHKPALKGDEVYLETTHSGVCGTDEHFKHSEMVLGHEGLGVVKEVGPEVVNLKVGDRVGWGYVTDSCGHCEHCLEGDYYYCDTRQSYGQGALDQGSFSSGAVWREGPLFKIPDSIPSEFAAPFFCAGSTVWGALTRSGVKPTDTVGVVGIGGLGHLAIQFAAKLGCDVVAFSGSEDKKEEAIKFGAKHFVVTKGVEKLQVPKKIKHLIVTTAQMPDWDQFAAVLAPRANVYPETITDFGEKNAIPHMQFLVNSWSVVYTTLITKIQMVQMLDFAARHEIRPVVEKYPLTKQGIVDSMSRLSQGKMRYRGILVGQGV